MIFKAYFKGKYRTYAWSMMTALISGLFLEAWLLTELNQFYKVFWEAMQNYDKPGALEVFYPQQWTYDGSLAWIAGLLIVGGTAVSYFSNKWVFWWRQSMFEEYIPRWLAINSNKVENPAQRIQEDTQKFAAFTRGIGRAGLKAVFTLFFFIPLIMEVSTLHFEDLRLLWLALAFSVGGIGVSALVGWKLPRLEYANQKWEAKLRKELVILEDNRGAFTKQNLTDTFTEVRKNYFRLYNNYAGYALWSRVYWQSMIFVPLFFTLDKYFATKMSIGAIQQIMNMFDKVNEAFSFLIDNWLTITELKSVTIRLNEFESEIYRRG